MAKHEHDLNPIEAAARQRSVMLRLVRLTFLALTITFTLLAVFRFREYEVVRGLAIHWWIPITTGLLLFGLAVAVDLLTPRKKLSTISGVFFGVIAGMLATLVLGFVLDLLLESWLDSTETITSLRPLVNSVKLLLAVSLCYLAVSTVLQTQDEFRLVIPYVEFAKQIRGVRPLVLDTSALIDGRMTDLAQARAFQAPLIIPGFVIDELQTLADSGDAMKRAKGRRGLEAVSRLQRIPFADVSIDDRAVQGKAVDQMLVELARALPASVVTIDTGLAKVCAIHAIGVININEIASALKPSLLPGEMISLRLIRPGEQPGQGVGYLPDGTMVVCEDGATCVGQDEVELAVLSSLQTSGGRLIFARLANPEAQAANRASDAPSGSSPVASPISEPETDPAPVDAVPDSTAPPASPGVSEARPARTPYPPHPPRSLRGTTPRNPRR
ncbi:MAG: PIN/TRAM domain-containing protein [Phycisphaerales bacterium]|nr:PIN/TRAM domain-containing protein [Phycisphaerales bacterium]